jgi:murein L,D-transpeptidase YafK
LAVISMAVVVYAGLLFCREHQRSGPEELAAANDMAERRMHDLGLKSGAPVYIRIFKEESEIELWMRHSETWVLLQNWPICRWSGRLGPKLRERNHQAPEGFYEVNLGSLNPDSRHHLSFNLGFPNRFDRFHGRTGSFLMVHGGCSSIGCYAVTDPVIDVIYRFVEAALRNGQHSIPVHIFPFRMTEEKLRRHVDARWQTFWRQIEPAYRAFESNHTVPQITVTNGRYLVNGRSSGALES